MIIAGVGSEFNIQQNLIDVLCSNRHANMNVLLSYLKTGVYCTFDCNIDLQLFVLAFILYLNVQLIRKPHR